MSEHRHGDISLQEAVNDYVVNVLSKRRDEEALIMPNTTDSLVLPDPVPTGTIVAIDDEETDWRDLV
jgi:hypothetical protein